MSDANMLFLPKEEVIQLLREAFDEGWNGYQDLRDSTADRLLLEYMEKRRQKKGSPLEVSVKPMPEHSFRPSSEERQTTMDFSTSTDATYFDTITVDYLNGSSTVINR